tara:strand:- start:477 stop:2159 length:1683 start_codon:yes stop_codon:yes gene_type:complete
MTTFRTIKQLIEILVAISREGKPILVLSILSFSAFISEILLLGSVGILLKTDKNIDFYQQFSILKSSSFLLIVIIFCCLFRVFINYSVIRFTHFFGSNIGEGIARNKFFIFEKINRETLTTDNTFIQILCNHTMTFVSCLQNIFMGIIGFFTALSIYIFLYFERFYLSIYSITSIAIIYFFIILITSRLQKRFSREVTINQKKLIGISRESLSISKELFISNRQEFVINKIKTIQSKIMRKLGNASFLIVFPKYTIEALLFVSFAFLILSGSLSEELIKQLPIIVLVALKIIPSFQSMYGAVSTLNLLTDAINEVYIGLIQNKLQKNFKNKDNNKYTKRVNELLINNYVDPFIKIKQNSFSIYFKKNSLNSKQFNIKEIPKEIKFGSSLCLYGESGSGKTTFLQNLVFNTFVSINKKNFKNFQLSTKLEYLDQKPNFISGTILENLIQDDKNINLDIVKELLISLKLCESVKEASLFLKLQIGDSSKLKLSGGEQQRLSIVRALCRKPDFLFADEFTSALDSDLELRTFLITKKFTKNLIFISHSEQLISKSDYKLSFPL